LRKPWPRKSNVLLHVARERVFQGLEHNTRVALCAVVCIARHLAQFTQRLTAAGSWYGERGAKWIIGNYGNTLYNHYYGPISPEWDCMNITQQMGLTAARSVHPGGVMTLFCDGSVQFMDDDVDLEVWRGLATRAQGEVSSQ
jgi:prepilin-type processing-associated H-X9-DG protein